MTDLRTHAARPGPVRIWLVGAPALALGGIAVGGWLGPLGDGTGEDGRAGGGTVASADGRAAVADLLDLPWPEEGQASAEVDGLGRLGGTAGQRPLPIASLTKVMTAYVILKEHPLADGEEGPAVTVDATAAQEAHSLSESTAPLREGQHLTQRRLLELLLLPSGNNVARLLARWDAGGQQEFVAKMNRAARDLGMNNTSYTGASGIEPTTRSTADDQLKLARHAMKEPVLRTVVAMRSTTVPGAPAPVLNTNRLLDRPGVVGLKTGSSTPAGGALMWAAEVDADGDRRLVLGVVLGQRAGTSPAEGLEEAFEKSGALIEAVQKDLPAALGERRDRS
ncbi:D-alanyl-D-alanine carboxypeptidase family protein [Streptomyces sp. NPDC014870]|uniref:D-alanyl-D-alanine carboxypeptidase family protein n=1 Tax=Streptomyces sp. NPDC014870 TaxID=3364925 RepID=UPI0036FA3823